MISQTHAERLLSENMPFPSVSAYACGEWKSGQCFHLQFEW